MAIDPGERNLEIEINVAHSGLMAFSELTATVKASPWAFLMIKMVESTK